MNIFSISINIFSAVILVVCSVPALAMSRAEICTWRGHFIEQFAILRDAGKSEKQTAAEAKRELKKLSPRAGDMKSYIKIVYAYPDIPPAKIRLLSEISCLQGD